MFSKRLIAIMIAIMMVISLGACSGTTANNSVLTETVATATDASAESSASSIPVDCTEAFESEPSPVPLDNGQRIAPVDNSCISVAEGEHGVFVTEGKLYALFGDNTDSLYGNIITVEKEIHPADDADTVILNVVSEPQLIETDVKQAIVFATGTAEEYYAGSYYASLLYIKNDGTLWVKGSNRNGMFGNVDTRSGAKLLDGVMKIYRGDHSVSAITEAGELYRWDFNAVNADDLPILIAVNVIAGSNSDLYYLNENGELCANNGENNVVLADNVRCFTTDIYRVAATFNDGTAKLYVPEMSALQGG